MTKTILPVLLLACSYGHAQSLWYYSILYTDPGSSLLTGHGSSQVQGVGSGATYIEATVISQLSNSSGYDDELNNCGDGCAYSTVYSYVGSLGASYSVASSHTGYVEYSDGYYWTVNCCTGSSDYANIPPAPQITLNWINAQQPHSVAWAFNVAGQLYSANLQLGSIVQTDTNSGSPWTFYLDQIQYPGGSNLAVMTGYNYGISVPGPQCYVDRSDGLSLPNSYTYTVYDGTRYFINAIHTVADVVSTFSYCVPTNSGDYITTFQRSVGSVDTTNNPSWTKHGIDTISENNEYSIYNDVLGPDPPDYPTVKYRLLPYYLGTIWIQKQASVLVCNTVFWLSTAGSGDHQNVYNAGPLGCEALSTP